MAERAELIDRDYDFLEWAERHRRKQRRKIKRLEIWLFAGVALVFGTIVSAAMQVLPTALVTMGLVGGFCTLFASGTIYYYAQQDLQAALKQQVVGPMLRRFGDNLNYRPKRGLSESNIGHSGLFHFRTAVQGKDFLQGQYGRTAFVCSYLEIHELGRPSNSPVWMKKTLGYNRREGFNGWMIIADGHKHFKGRTLVFPDKLEKHLGGWLSKRLSGMRFSNLQPVDLEDPDFEREFEVYTSDQVEARYLLTPDMMERLLKLKSKLRTEIKVAFNRGTVYIAIEGIESLDVDLHRPLKAGWEKSKVDARWSLICAVIDGLGLNERLWSKA